MLEITKNINIDDIKCILGGDLPPYHPPTYWKSLIQSGHLFIATINNIPAGLLAYSIWWGNCPFIELVKVKTEFQRNNIGTALLSHAINELKQDNFKEIISSSEVINDMGVSFHIKNKFEKINTLMLPHGEEQFFKLTINDAT